MKVLEILGEPIGNGGQESFVVNVLNHMELEGLEVDLLTPYYCENDYYREIIHKIGGEIYTFNLPFHPGGLRFNIIRPLNKFLADNRYDVVHIHAGNISVLALASLCARIKGINKIVVHSHAAAAKKTLKYRLVKTVTFPIMSLCPTNYCACSLKAGVWKFPRKVVKNKLQILKNGVDLQQFSFDSDKRRVMREKLGIGDREFVIGHVGRFSYEKNHEFLLKVFAEIKKRHANSRLILIGTGELENKIKEKCYECSLEKDVIFCGTVNNVYDYFQCMDVFVLPSYYEGLPIVGIEAQANGLPVITSTNVTGEMKIADNVEFISLNEPEEKWAMEILKYNNCPRKNNKNLLRQAGYDIKETAAEMKKIYII